MSEKELMSKSVDVIMKSFTELRQTPKEEDVIVVSQSLAKDLAKRFSDFDWYDVEQAFERGTRQTDDYVINVKTYWKWLTFWKKQVIDEATYQVRTMNQPKNRIPYYIEKAKHEKLLLTTKTKNNG